MPFPFEIPFAQVEANLDAFIDEVFGALQSEFLNLPKGDGFVDYATFSKGYEELKAATKDFRDLSSEPIVAANLPDTDQLHRVARDFGLYAARVGLHHDAT